MTLPRAVGHFPLGELITLVILKDLVMLSESMRTVARESAKIEELSVRGVPFWISKRACSIIVAFVFSKNESGRGC